MKGNSFETNPVNEMRKTKADIKAEKEYGSTVEDIRAVMNAWHCSWNEACEVIKLKELKDINKKLDTLDTIDKTLYNK